MIFVESSIFTADVKELLSDEDYAALQDHLANQPDAGDLIKQTGGLRKVRWRVKGSDKRGGVRARNLLSRRRGGADSDDPDLPKGREGRSDAKGESDST